MEENLLLEKDLILYDVSFIKVFEFFGEIKFYIIISSGKV